jgi:hypothetical protein
MNTRVGDRWHPYISSVVVLVIVTTSCNTAAASTPETRAQASVIGELAGFDLLVEGWVGKTSVPTVVVEKVGGSYGTGSSTATMTWTSSEATESEDWTRFADVLADAFEVDGFVERRVDCDERKILLRATLSAGPYPRFDATTIVNGSTSVVSAVVFAKDNFGDLPVGDSVDSLSDCP